ncbi:MAG TPA: hypothetical protein VKC66_01085 [Xanthobacteraceae bacterium]|nr:hypothetical protein [Xanthobacteraceae bacterium]
MHDLRGSHETVSLDAAESVHVAAERRGQNPAALPHNYAEQADAAAADVIGALTKGVRVSCRNWSKPYFVRTPFQLFRSP